MLDALYSLATVLFFALMLAYVAGCARLGRTNEIEREASHDSR